MVLLRKPMHGTLCDFRNTTAVPENLARNLAQRVRDWDYTVLDPSRTNRITSRISVRDADRNDRRVCFLTEIGRDDKKPASFCHEGPFSKPSE